MVFGGMVPQHTAAYLEPFPEGNVQVFPISRTEPMDRSRSLVSFPSRIFHANGM